MTDDTNFLEWAFKGIVGGAFVVGGYLWLDLVKDVKSLGKSHADFQLDAEKRFVNQDGFRNFSQSIQQQLQTLQSSIQSNNNMTSEIRTNTAVLSERIEAIGKNK